MGNALAKESDSSSHQTPPRTARGNKDSQLSSTWPRHPESNALRTENSRTSHTGPSHSDHSNPSHPHRSDHIDHTERHHNGSKSHKSHRSRKRNADYEMIVDLNETVDGGLLFPQGVYQGAQDFKVSVVREKIILRKMAPFYKGLDSVEPEWTDEELVNNVKAEDPANSPKPGQPGPASPTQLVWLYRNTHECPICFLVYPRLNSTQCCGQSICTECFVQIKRNPPHVPYNDNNEATDVLDLLSDPAACPYCARPDLGIVFEAPPFEWGLPANTITKEGTKEGTKEVGVTVDMIRPDWEEKLASARRRLARKSAAARALHQQALLPNGTQSSSENSIAQNSQRTNSSRMTVREARALEQKMIEEAIKRSLETES